MSREEFYKQCPKAIYLIVTDDYQEPYPHFGDANDIQWCQDDLYSEGFEYIKKTEYDRIEAEVAELKNFIQKFIRQNPCLSVEDWDRLDQLGLKPTSNE